jgi:hypothetical protein
MRRGFGPPGGGREGACEAKGRKPGLREQPVPIQGEGRGGLGEGFGNVCEMTPTQLLQRTKAIGIEATVAELLDAQIVAACSDASRYQDFCRRVVLAYPNAEQVFIAGSGNWGFSLNPEKALRSFGEYSDIDVGVVHESFFNTTWEELRKYHRMFFYRISSRKKENLRRNGENIYSGFVTPAWIPDAGNNFRFQHSKILNALSSQLVGFKPVKMLFFKNRTEAIDYYKRGIMPLQ